MTDFQVQTFYKCYAHKSVSTSSVVPAKQHFTPMFEHILFPVEVRDVSPELSVMSYMNSLQGAEIH